MITNGVGIAGLRVIGNAQAPTLAMAGFNQHKIDIILFDQLHSANTAIGVAGKLEGAVVFAVGLEYGYKGMFGAIAYSLYHRVFAAQIEIRVVRAKLREQNLLVLRAD